MAEGVVLTEACINPSEEGEGFIREGPRDHLMKAVYVLSGRTTCSHGI